MNENIKLEAELDLSKELPEIRVRAMKDPWMDFGIYLEVTGFLAHQAMKYREWTPEKTADYARDYILKCLKDYKIKPTNPKP